MSAGIRFAVAMLSFALLPVWASSEMSREELAVRGIYAKFVLGSRVESVLNPPASGVTVQISNVRVGPVQDILNVPLTKLVTIPSGNTDVLSAGSATWSLNDHGTDRHLASYVSVSGWQRADTKYGEMLTKGRVLTLSDIPDEDWSACDRYAAYDVVLTHEGKQRQYSALILFGLGTSFRIIDYVADTSVLTYVATCSLAQDAQHLADILGAVGDLAAADAREALEPLRAEPGCAFEPVSQMCCDPSTGRCGF